MDLTSLYRSLLTISARVIFFRAAISVNGNLSCMRKSIIEVIILVTGIVSLRGQAVSHQARLSLVHESDVETAFQWDHFPQWSGHHLVGFYNSPSRAPVIYTIDAAGKREEVLFTLEDAAEVRIVGVSGSRDGQIAVIGTAVTSDNRGITFLARLASDRKRQLVTRTWPYVPKVVAFAPDDTIWTVGTLKVGDDPARYTPGHFLRRFDASGRMVTSSVVKTEGPDSFGEEVSFLRASRDRVGWYTRDGEYIEFSLDGAEIDRYVGPDGANWRRVDGVALSEDDEVIVGMFEKGTARAGFLVLDREARTWNQVALPREDTPRWAWVLGFDGRSLVADTVNGRLTFYRRSPDPR